MDFLFLAGIGVVFLAVEMALVLLITALRSRYERAGETAWEPIPLPEVRSGGREGRDTRSSVSPETACASR